MKLRGRQAEWESTLQQFLPPVNFGVKCMSIDFLGGSGASPPHPDGRSVVAWRGLMQTKGIGQLIWRTQWGQLDYLIVDMPPGTGDIHLAIGQTLKTDGALIVSTPQEIAVQNSLKGLYLWEKLGIPIIGTVKNMSSFECKDAKNNSNDSLSRNSELANYPVLATIPFDIELLKSADEGNPFVLKFPDSLIATEFFKMAAEIEEKLNQKKFIRQVI